MKPISTSKKKINKIKYSFSKYNITIVDSER